MNWKQIKLPRKRKKVFIKDLGKSEYLGYRFVNQTLLEEGSINYPRFRTYDEYGDMKNQY